MRVRFERAESLDGDVTKVSERWLIPGRDYVVLELLVGKRTTVRLKTEDGTLGIFDLRRFAIVDGRLSREWQIGPLAKGGLKLAPPEWNGIWERYFEGKKDAIELVDRIVERIVAE